MKKNKYSTHVWVLSPDCSVDIGDITVWRFHCDVLRRIACGQFIGPTSVRVVNCLFIFVVNHTIIILLLPIWEKSAGSIMGE